AEDRSRQMTRNLAVATVLIVLGASALAGDEPGKDAKGAKPAVETKTRVELASEAKEQFTRADANGDGYLKGDEIVKGWLEKYDLDFDGKISRTEFVDVSS